MLKYTYSPHQAQLDRYTLIEQSYAPIDQSNESAQQ